MVCPISQTSAVSLRSQGDPENVLGGTFSVAFGLRSYSPDLGRWVNRDPIGDYSLLASLLKGRSRREKEALTEQSLGPLYLALGNTPPGELDLLGMYSLGELLCIGCVCGAGVQVIRLKAIVEIVSDDADERFPFPSGSSETDETNAYRHCLGACRSMRTVTPGCALGAQWCHERFGEATEIDKRADKRNNRVGNLLAPRLGTCANLCFQAMVDGNLDCRGRPCDPDSGSF